MASARKSEETRKSSGICIYVKTLYKKSNDRQIEIEEKYRRRRKRDTILYISSNQDGTSTSKPTHRIPYLPHIQTGYPATKDPEDKSRNYAHALYTK